MDWATLSKRYLTTGLELTDFDDPVFWRLDNEVARVRLDWVVNMHRFQPGRPLGAMYCVSQFFT